MNIADFMPNQKDFEHYVSPHAKGEQCGMCYRDGVPDVPASHKVGEEMHDHPALGRQPRRHNWTQYLCCTCFGRVLGPAVVEWCNSENKEGFTPLPDKVRDL